MTIVAKALRALGWALLAAGAVAFGGIFLIVALEGGWPAWLAPVRDYYQLLSGLGPASLIVEIWTFIGPGALVAWLGSSLLERAKRAAAYPTKQRVS